PIYVQPSGPPAVGELLTGIRATMRIPHAKQPATPVESFDWQRRAPRTFAARHSLSDFAAVKATYYADGRERKGFYGRGTAGFITRAVGGSLQPVPDPVAAP